ncbi:hypothetical protein Pla123a_12740 [Posidoniimonas polymericola]|uniref:Zinc finger/thioredoxin putative domain-containing protein n=2 Tax=Posidoniimonas polymericola TaxID=2528002 RepID=A0A5C5YTZ5_9BACT|nr:hypothetical protein Pla123a_12740 [Posidoniimonas polymericola]
MSRDNRIAVDCSNCGQVYQVMPPQADLRAQCRRCGTVFVIPATAAARPGGGRPVRRPSEEGRAADALAVLPLVAAGGGVLGMRSLRVEDQQAAPSEAMPRSRVARLSKPRGEQRFASLSPRRDAAPAAALDLRFA